MSKHTPEPCRISAANDCTILDANGISSAVANSPEFARRIVACVNACRDIPNEALDLSCEVGGMAAQMLRRIDAEKQRDELVAALRLLVEIVDKAVGMPYAKDNRHNLSVAADNARVALEKVQS